MKPASLFYRSACTAVFGALAVVPAHAAVFNVTTTADSGLGSLRRAINEANKTPDQDRILFNLPPYERQAGVWNIDLQSALPTITQPVRIVGPGSTKLRIRVPTFKHQIFIVKSASNVPAQNQEAPNHYFSGLTLLGGRGSGGAVYALRSKLEFNDVRFRDNVAVQDTDFGTGRGGAVASIAGGLSFTNCVFNSNRAPQGGAVYIGYGGFSRFTACSFRENTATGSSLDVLQGGAILSEGNLILEGCSFVSNKADLGSAIALPQETPSQTNPVPGPQVLLASGCTFESNSESSTANSAPWSRGTIYGEIANLDVRETIFRYNTMDLGAAINKGEGVAEFTRCLFLANTGLTGSALRTSGGTTRILNSTLMNNNVSHGGVIDNDTNSREFLNTLVVNCTFNQNAVAENSFEFNAGSGTISVLNSIINLSGAGQASTSANGQFVSLGHNLVFGPNNPYLGGPDDISGKDPLFDENGLQDNGGSTPTLALRPGSPALNAGDNAVLNAPYNLDVDQRGQGFPRKVGSAVDIGAFEVQQPAALKAGPSGNSS